MATWEVGEGGGEIDQNSDKTSMGRVLVERLEQVFCHDLVLALDITVEVYLLIEI